MDVQLRQDDRLRINSGSRLEDVFIALAFVRNSDEMNCNEGLSIDLHQMHQLFIVEKEGEVKVFAFRKDDKVFNKNFGWWADGKIVFTNSKVLEAETE